MGTLGPCYLLTWLPIDVMALVPSVFDIVIAAGGHLVHESISAAAFKQLLLSAPPPVPYVAPPPLSLASSKAVKRLPLGPLVGPGGL